MYRCSAPTKILEYYACGVPTLASRMSAHVYIASLLDGVYLFENAESFVENVIKYQGTKIVPTTKQLSSQSMAEELLHIYQKLLGKPS